ncbi:MAG TPA: hypothetical protein VKB80_35620 [Kofleriaceae bacterium]|nr:hypothetical protein [Kofleriaceae bacterium]
MISLALLGCGLPAPPPASGSASQDPIDAAVNLPSDDGEGDGGETPDVDAAPPADARQQARVLSQTTSSAIEPDASIICSDDDGINFENSYYRVFDLQAEGIMSGFHVTQVSIGVERAAGGGDGTQPIEVRLHTLNGEQLGTDNLSSLATSSQDVPDGQGTHVEFPFDADVPAGAQLTVEVHVPDGGDTGDSFLLGANDDGQTAPGYILAQQCGDDQPADMAEIGFPDVDIIIEVTGE